MAVNLVATYTANLGSNPNVLVTGLPLTDGNLLVAVVTSDASIDFDGVGAGDNGIAQTGATWVNIFAQQSIDSVYATSVWYAENISSAVDSITIDDSGMGIAGGTAVFLEFSGVETSGAFIASNRQNFDNVLDLDNSGTIAATDNSLLVGIATSVRNDNTFTPDGPWTAAASQVNPTFGDGEIFTFWRDAGVSPGSVSFGGDLGGGTYGDALAAILGFEAAPPVTYTIDSSVNQVVAVTRSIDTDTDVVVAQNLSITFDADVNVTDAPAFVIEPDRPKYPPTITASDLRTTASFQGVSSPTVNFETLGVAIGDVIEIEGLNAGHYVVIAVDQGTVSFGEKLTNDDPGPFNGYVRPRRDATAVFTAAAVTTLPFFNAGFSVGASVSVNIA